MSYGMRLLCVYKYSEFHFAAFGKTAYIYASSECSGDFLGNEESDTASFGILCV